MTPHLLLGALALLNPTNSVTIADSKGKFDFLEVDSAHRRLLAAHEKDGTADFIDLKTNQLIKRVKTGPAVHICLDPKNGKYFVSASEDKKVVVLDAESLEPAGEVATEGELDAILYEPKNNRIYVTNDEGDHVFVIDPDALKVVETIDIKGPPEYMLYDKAADRIYLNLKKENAIAVIDPNSNKVVETWSTGDCEGPHGLAFNAEKHRLYAGGANGKLAIVSSTDGKVIGTVDIEKGVDQVAYDEATGRIYCASGAKWSVVEETDDGAKNIGDVDMAATAKNVAVDPITHLVWTTYTDGTNSYAKAFTAWGRAADNKIFAQTIADDLMKKHSDLLVVGLHAVPPDSDQEQMIATNLDRVGKKDDDDDIAVTQEGKTILAPNLVESNKFEVQQPILDGSGNTVGSMGLVWQYKKGDSLVKLLTKSIEIQKYIAKRIDNKQALFKARE